jgi:hypothetical protein
LHAISCADATVLGCFGALQVQQFYMGMGKLMGLKLEKMSSPATVA